MQVEQTAGRKYPTTEAGGALAWEDIGTTDKDLLLQVLLLQLQGEVRFTVLYSQNII